MAANPGRLTTTLAGGDDVVGPRLNATTSVDDHQLSRLLLLKTLHDETMSNWTLHGRQLKYFSSSHPKAIVHAHRYHLVVAWWSK